MADNPQPAKQVTPEEQIKMDELAKKVNEMGLERLTQAKAEALEVLQKLEQKSAEIKKFVTDTELQGRSFGVPLPPQMSEEEKSVAAAKRLLEGTGLNPFR